MRALLVSAVFCVAFVHAGRMRADSIVEVEVGADAEFETGADAESEIGADAEFEFGDGIEIGYEVEARASCEKQQRIFLKRAGQLDAMIGTYHGVRVVRGRARAGFILKSFRILRLLRLAKDCTWVVDGDNAEDIAVVSAIVKTTLASNPCASAAVGALATDRSEHEMHPLERAMQILVSETCDIESERELEIVEDDPEEEDAEALTRRVIDMEEKVQHSAEELVEETESADEQVKETNPKGMSVDRLFHVIGAIFLGILYILSCSVAGAFIGAAFGIFLTFVFLLINPHSTILVIHMAMVSATVAAGVGGACGLHAADSMSSLLELDR